MTIEGAISYYEGQAVYAKDHGYPLAGEWNGQIAAWLRELAERRKAPEIITGEWELKDHQWECDKCGCRINVKNPLDCDKWNYYYCPHCGTKMLIAVQRGR